MCDMIYLAVILIVSLLIVNEVNDILTGLPWWLRRYRICLQGWRPGFILSRFLFCERLLCFPSFLLLTGGCSLYILHTWERKREAMICGGIYFLWQYPLHQEERKRPCSYDQQSVFLQLWWKHANFFSINLWLIFDRIEKVSFGTLKILESFFSNPSS